MTSTQILSIFALLVGGLTFFLFGMNVMSSGLERMAGGALERTMKKVTSNDFLGFFLGAGVTIAIQSSSAMTVMLVGLVNSGIVDFSNTFGMIMGSNVGTTLTAWLLSLTGIDGDSFFLTLLQPSTFAPILAFIGIAMQMMSKSEKKRNLGSIFIGFAILIFGMDMMSDSMSFLKGEEGKEALQALLTVFSSSILALLASTLFTGIIQSSAATIGMVQALALTGEITYEMAIPLVLGANIGTCITALISSVGTNKNAKRVVALHLSVNIIGSLICMAILYIVKFTAPSFVALPVGMVHVAIIHTLFNVVTTVVLTPVKKPLINFCAKCIPDKDTPQKKHVAFLDERIFNNTALAISECRRLTIEMAQYSHEAILKSISLLNNYKEDTAEEIVNLELLTDKYEDKLSTYLVKLSNSELSESESHQVAQLLHSIGDFERISDHALNIRDAAAEIKEKNIVFSDSANKEINTITKAIKEILSITVEAFSLDDPEIASKVEPLEQVIDGLRTELKERHVDRLQNGECTIELGFVFTDILTNYERVSDHCSNIAVYVMQLNSDKLDAHKYLRKLRSDETGEFAAEFERFNKKYSI